MRVVIIKLDTRNLDSYNKAEKRKQELENEGYNLIETRQVDFNNWEMIYQLN